MQLSPIFFFFWGGDIIKKTADSTVYLVGTKRKAKIYNKEKEKAKNQRKMANRRMKRLKKTPRICEYIQLYNSSPDKEREGSTLMNVNPNTMKDLMGSVKKILDLYHIKLINFQHVNFLDVGSGTGCVLAAMRNLRKMKCVGIVKSLCTWRGSTLYFHQIINRSSSKILSSHEILSPE